MKLTTAAAESHTAQPAAAAGTRKRLQPPRSELFFFMKNCLKNRKATTQTVPAPFCCDTQTTTNSERIKESVFFFVVCDVIMLSDSY